MVNRYGTDEGWQFAIDTPASTKRLFQNILEVEKPIIAAINGDAVGLGATLALFADSTVIAEHGEVRGFAREGRLGRRRRRRRGSGRSWWDRTAPRSSSCAAS